MRTLDVIAVAGMGLCVGGAVYAQNKDLPTSKQMIGVIPGNPQRLNSLPMSIAVSPDGRYVVTVNAGYGTFESGYMQSLAVMDTQTGRVADFPDDRTAVRAKQTLYSGLAFSGDGRHVYASMGSTSNPLGGSVEKAGSGVVVYGFADGKLVRERMISLPLQPLAAGRTTKLVGGVDGDKGVPFPAAIAVVEGAAGSSTSAGSAQRDSVGESKKAVRFANAHISESRYGAPGSGGGERLLVADNLSDDVLLLDAETGKVETRFDLAESDAVPSTYPVALAVAKDGRRAFVALWNASEVVELDLVKGTVGRKVALLKPADPVKPGTHPCALEIAPDGKTMYVALANRDAVAAVNVEAGQFAVRGYFDTRLPGQSYFGAEPEALAVSADGSRLYAADSALDAVAVIDTTKLKGKAAKQGMVKPMGFIPTEWMPMSMTQAGGKLYVATAKGTGTGPNNMAQRPAKGLQRLGASTYIGTLLYGSLAAIDTAGIAAELSKWTQTVLESNRMKAAGERIAFAGGGEGKADSSASLRNDKQEGIRNDKQGGTRNDKQGGVGSGKQEVLRNDKQESARNDEANGPIKHVIYIIKENRTYDQVFGDLKSDGKPVGNGDASLTMYGEAVTPNQHKLALQFGVLDNFFDSGEVSGDGHVWSTAAIGTDYLEKTWQQSYRGAERTYDFEGVVAEGYPLLQKIPDVNEPMSGYLWGNLAAHGKTYYHFGEFISTKFCGEKETANPQQGPLLAGRSCTPGLVKPGEKLPEEWGGGVNKWPWGIPLMASNIATKPELVGHFAEEAPDFNLRVPDQVRADIFMKHLAGWVKDKEQGRDTMPNFVMLRFGNDHTAGTTPGGPTPKSSVADNDLAIGRAVEAISHSPFWDDTAFFILEDDAQNGGDHVDAHRSLALVVSKYAPHGADGGPFVDSRFYSTVSTIRTMETLLGLPPMNNNDAFSSMISTEFTGPGDQAAFTADVSNRENGLIYTANQRTAPGAKESMKMDFRHADRADAQRLNVILWKDAMGDAAVPASLRERRKKTKKDDDD